jgi:hypothetical protein
MLILTLFNDAVSSTKVIINLIFKQQLWCYYPAKSKASALKIEAVFSPKRWYLPTSPHEITTQKTNIYIGILFPAVKTSP